MNRLMQKKPLCILIILVLTVMLSVSVLAVHSVGEANVTIVDNNLTITIHDVEELTPEQIERITDLVSEYHSDHLSYEPVVSYGLMCTLLGHDKQLHSVSAIEHKVRSTNPRCLETHYKVTTCSRCEYENIEVLAETYISCCD